MVGGGGGGGAGGDTAYEAAKVLAYGVDPPADTVGYEGVCCQENEDAINYKY